MDHDTLITELNRLIELLGTLDPTEAEYGKVLDKAKTLMDMHLNEDKTCEDALKKEQDAEIDRKRIELEQRKLELEEKKLEFQREEAAAKLEAEERKEANERAERARMVPRQAMQTLVGIGAQTVCTAGLLCLIGRIEGVAILPKSMMGFLRKV